MPDDLASGPVPAIFSREADQNALTQTKRGKAKDRGNGDGSLWELPDGRYRWQLTVTVVNGKQHRVSGTEPTKTLAKRALEKAQADRDRGLLATPDRVTVSEFAETWLKRQEGLSKRSISTYRKELAYALEHIGKMKVRDVRAPQLKSLMGTLAARAMGKRGEDGKTIKEDAETMAPRTLGKVLTRIRALFREAVQDQIIYVNPADGVKKPKMPVTEAVGVVLDFDQKARLHELGEALYTAGVCALWPALFAAFSIGLRRSEVMGLRWEDVNLEASGSSHEKNGSGYGDRCGFSRLESLQIPCDDPLVGHLLWTCTIEFKYLGMF